MGSDRISPRARWVAYGDLRNPGNAVDGLISTAAVSGSEYRGATITIDLGKTCMFNMVAVEHGSDALGYPRRMAILTSDDGQTFHLQMVVAGLPRVSSAVFVRPVLARYVRLRADTEGHRPWSVAEVFLN